MESDRLVSPGEDSSGDNMKNFYRCRLTCLAPKDKGKSLAKSVTKLTSWFDPYQQIITIDENVSSEKDKRTARTKGLKTKGCLVTPAISVMLYIRETGEMCAKDAEKLLKKSPWTFHHKVELQNKSCPMTSLAKQEFYKLASDLPLFAVCPVLTESEHLRISLYVHDFPAMVEFYRLVTDTEMETQKPEFCVFPLYQQPGLDVQLSLKRSKYIFPVPVDAAYVSFNVKNIDAVKLALNTDVRHVKGNVYTTRDPDGNLVVLYETSCMDNRSASYAASTDYLHGEPGSALDDLKSLKSTAESHDSGRYSDPEDGPIVHGETANKRSRDVRTVSEASDGYSSSANLSVIGEAQGGEGGNSKTLAQSTEAGVTALKRRNTFTGNKENKPSDFAPVYI